MKSLQSRTFLPINRLNILGVVENWLVAGAFPNQPIPGVIEGGMPTREGYGMDFLAALGGETNVELGSDTVIRWEGQQLPVVSRAMNNGVLDFRKIYPLSDDRVAYAFCYLDHPCDEEVACEFGSDDSAKVWMNGSLVHSSWAPKGRACVPGEEKFRIPLKEGRNRLLVKVENYRSDWKFALSVYSDKNEKEVKHNQALSTTMRGFPPVDLAVQRPLFDVFGQFRHGQWPGKIRKKEDLPQRDQEESRAISSSPSLNWNVYGGWNSGPALEATGFFRTERYEGKWWLVDPLGKLFFSHGIDHVVYGEKTPLDGRESWFEEFPATEGEFSKCYDTGSGLHGYYRGKSPRTFDFAKANLIRKYGSEWENIHAERTHRRLRAWGLNTFGAWSDPTIYRARKTPYTVYLNSGGRSLGGNSGYWYAFSDVFDPSFRESLGKQFRLEIGKSAGDPWCLGYFIDNELSWDSETNLAESTLRSPSGQPAKLAFQEQLSRKYTDIQSLNTAWGTTYMSWKDWEESTVVPNREKAGADLRDFSRHFAEVYFQTCRAVVKEFAPDNLYLGCRFAHAHSNHGMPASVAAKYCDVVSYNLYKLQVDEVSLPDKSDVPVIIGEFHFGALDRGLFHPGLREVESQEARAATYKQYVKSALRHPQIVGCHWFQFRDSPTSGRLADGENYQIGFVDITDTPYSETVAASRDVAETMYETRFEKLAAK